MKALLKYYLLLLALLFAYSPAAAQIKGDRSSSRQAKALMKEEQGREKQRRKNIKAAKATQPQGDTDAKYAHLFPKKKREKIKARKEKDHKVFE